MCTADPFPPQVCVGLMGSCQTMFFYAEVTDAQHSGPGGGRPEEGELIEVVYLPLAGAQAFVDSRDSSKTLGVIFGISRFFSHVAPTCVSREGLYSAPHHNKGLYSSGASICWLHAPQPGPAL